MVDCLKCKEDILPLFDKEDVLIDEGPGPSWEGAGTVLYIRPAKKYNRNSYWNYLIKIVFDYQKACVSVYTCEKVQFNLETKQVECYGEISSFMLTKTTILSILSDYSVACENFRKYYKNKKITEIKGICSKYTV
jgi:hypothetical protein